MLAFIGMALTKSEITEVPSFTLYEYKWLQTRKRKYFCSRLSTFPYLPLYSLSHVPFHPVVPLSEHESYKWCSQQFQMRTPQTKFAFVLVPLCVTETWQRNNRRVSQWHRDSQSWIQYITNQFFLFTSTGRGGGQFDSNNTSCQVVSCHHYD